MKTCVIQKWNSAASRRAFTVTEIMVVGSLLLLVIGGVLSTHMFGIRMFQITKAKLGASDEARKAISKLVSEVRSSKMVKVGEGSLTTFTEVGVDSPQKGSAIQVYPGVETNNFIRYFWDSGDKRLKRTTNGATSVAIIANYVTNNLVFTCEDFAGNILTNNQNNRVIALTLQFFQIEFPVVSIGPGHTYDFYQLRTKMTRRNLE